MIFTWHFLEDARNGARVLISIYGLLVHMFISPHFFHGFVSSQRRFAWNSCVLEPFDEKKTSFYSSSSRIVGFLGQFAECFKQVRPRVHSEQKRPNIFLQTMVVTSGGLVAAAKLFRYVSFQLIPCLIKALRTCQLWNTADTHQHPIMLRSINHVSMCSSATNGNIPPISVPY